MLGHCSAWLWLACGAPAFAAATQTILVLGDSLSAEYGLPRGSGWVALLGRRLAEQKIAAQVVNASISGDTTSGGRSRLPALLKQHRPDVLVLELGANDALRGLPLAMTKANLLEMTRAAKAAGADVVLVGMQVPPNYGQAYGDEFARLFAEVARSEHAANLFQADRIHPSQAAHPRMLDNVWRVLAPLLR